MSAGTDELGGWIAGRTPPVPAGFQEWMEPRETGGGGSPIASLTIEAEAALARALSPEGRPRGGAFDLLAADGFLTWAAEAALEESDADAALSGLVDRFSR